MTTLEIIRNNLIDKIIAINNGNLLSAIANILNLPNQKKNTAIFGAN